MTKSEKPHLQNKGAIAANTRRGLVSVEEIEGQILTLELLTKRLRTVLEAMRIHRQKAVRIDGCKKFQNAEPELHTYVGNLRRAMVEVEDNNDDV